MFFERDDEAVQHLANLAQFADRLFEICRGWITKSAAYIELCVELSFQALCNIETVDVGRERAALPPEPRLRSRGLQSTSCNGVTLVKP